MRMIVAASVALMLSAVSSAAQTVRPNVIVPQLPPVAVNPVEAEGARIESPPEFGEPHFTTDELARAAARKVELLHGFNMTDATEAWLRPSMWATPHYSSGAYLRAPPRPDLISIFRSSTPAMPHGAMGQSVLRGDITVSAPASVRRWLLFDCIVDAATATHGASRFRSYVSGSESVTLTQTDDHRVVQLFPPSVSPELRFRLIPSGCTLADTRRQWFFGGCEITPIEPP